MVTVLPSDRTGLDVLGKYLGQGMSNAMPQMYENMKYKRSMNAIDQLQQSLKPQVDQNGQPIPQNMGDTLSNLARAIAANPSLERSGIADYIMKTAQANASQQVPLPNSRDRSNIPTPDQIPKRGPAPTFLNQPSQENPFFPNNIGPQGGPGNVPQEATSGTKIPIKTPSEMAKEAPGYAKELTSNGSPTTTREAYELLKSQNQDARDHNRDVDEELSKRVQGQKEYGARGMKALEKRYKNAPQELRNVFEKMGENESKKGKSEADINAFIDKEAEKISHSIKNIQSSPSPNRSHNKLYRALNGSYRNFDKAAEDMRKNIQPLIDLGLYDFARNLVSTAGYYPEEREMIVNPLSEKVQSTFNSLPFGGSGKSGSFSITPSMIGREVDITPLKEAIVKAQNYDNNFSLVLGRKLAEENGYNWNQYKDALNQLESEGFKLSDDQAIHRGELDTPPMTFLETFLHDIGFTGR